MAKLNDAADGVRPVPVPTVLSRPFWDGCREGRLCYQRCKSCGEPNFPPEAVCPRCLSEDLGWETSSGVGTVYTKSVLHSAPSHGFPVPSVLAIVELAEGYAMFTNIIECDLEDVDIGMQVEVRFERVNDEISLPFFRPT